MAQARGTVLRAMRTSRMTLAFLLAMTSMASGNSVAPPAPSEQALQAQEDASWAGGTTIKGDENSNYVAFTFDDGPDPATTPIVIDALREYEVPAAFFVVGRRFAGDGETGQQGRELLRTMAADGFLIGNHTTRHQSLSSQPFASATKSIETNASDLAKVLGYEPRLFRPPYGATTSKIRKLLRARGDTMVRWNIDPQDFQRTKRKKLREAVVQSILARRGGVVLLHDTKAATAGAIKGILEDLEKANCERISQGMAPILPVSLHYFMKESDGSARPIPAEVMRTTQKTRSKLQIACEKYN